MNNLSEIMIDAIEKSCRFLNISPKEAKDKTQTTLDKIKNE